MKTIMRQLNRTVPFISLLMEGIIEKKVTAISDSDISLITEFMDNTANQLIQSHPGEFTNDIKSTFIGMKNSLVNINMPAPQASYSNPGSLDTVGILNYTTRSIYEDYVSEKLTAN